jgi:hypothetical protein
MRFAAKRNFLDKKRLKRSCRLKKNTPDEKKISFFCTQRAIAVIAAAAENWFRTGHCVRADAIAIAGFYRLNGIGHDCAQSQLHSGPSTCTAWILAGSFNSTCMGLGLSDAYFVSFGALSTSA